MEKTLLDEFALTALSGLIATKRSGSTEGFASVAYNMAAAMMAERAKREQAPLMQAVPEDPSFPDGQMVDKPVNIEPWVDAELKRLHGIIDELQYKSREYIRQRSAIQQQLAEQTELAEQLEQELIMHKANTENLADLVDYCVANGIGKAGDLAHKSIMAECDAQAKRIASLLTDRNILQTALAGVMQFTSIQPELDKAKAVMNYMAQQDDEGGL